MKNHLVSILLPCYNVEPFLSQSLESLIFQTYRNLQIVLIDDGSTDNTWQLLQTWKEKDSRIEIYHQENQGVAATRNHLLEKVKGDYVLFVDSDDWVELEMVEFLVQQIEQEQADIVTCGMVVNDTPINQFKVMKEHWNQEKTVYEFLRHASFGGSLCNKLLKSSLLHNVRFHCGISYGEDALFVWEVLQKVQKVVVTDKKLYHYRMNENSISHSSYGEKKISGHLVWKQFSEDTARLWPKYHRLAETNYAISDMWQMYYAAQSNYQKDNYICMFQKNVRSHLLMIYSSGLLDAKKMFFAMVAAISYRLCKCFIK